MLFWTWMPPQRPRRPPRTLKSHGRKGLAPELQDVKSTVAGRQPSRADRRVASGAKRVSQSTAIQTRRGSPHASR